MDTAPSPAPLLAVNDGSRRGQNGAKDAAPARDHTALISALSNLSIQYNLTSIAVALALMDDSANHKGDPSYIPPYPRTGPQESLLKSLVFAGAICGQLCMGYAGDVWGRRNAMVLTNALTFVGVLGSAAFTWGDHVYEILMACRFLIGVGVGGKYPLSAVLRAEACEEGGEDAGSTATDVAKGFFWQTPGAMLPCGTCLMEPPRHSGLGPALA